MEIGKKLVENKHVFLDYGDMTHLAFDVAYYDNQYNLILSFLKFKENEYELVSSEAVIIRTTIIKPNLLDMHEKIKDIMAMGLFDNLKYLKHGRLTEINKTPITVEWNDFNTGVEKGQLH